MSSNDRYAVYASDASPERREILGEDWPHYKVWDRELNMSVPFGGYGTVDAAQRRAYRMNHPTGWGTGEYILCLSCADVHRPGQTTDRAGWLPIQGNVLVSCDWCGDDLRRTDTRVKSCDAFADHGPHSHGSSDLRCPGNGPFMDVELSKLEPSTYPGPPCVCTDSIWSSLGYCPPKGDREYGMCPVRRGFLTRGTEGR